MNCACAAQRAAAKGGKTAFVNSNSLPGRQAVPKES
jgi:hypothetical protein